MNLPKVTLMIVVRNEKDYIEKSLNSLLHQDYPKDLTEILIIDGNSTDGTRECLKKKVKELVARNINIRLLENPKKILASGWNIGIKNAKGDIVCRIDAHSELYPDYITKGVETLLKMKSQRVICVGGVLEHIGVGVLGKAIANLFSSKFAVGNSPFRTDSNFVPRFSSTKVTDTAVYGLYWKKIFDKVGYFNENLERNQDVELHSKIMKQGYYFVTNPAMRAKYYVRTTIYKLLKKAFRDGYWVAFLDKASFRHKVPFMFSLYLLTLPFLFAIFSLLTLQKWLFYFILFPLLLYIIGVVYFSFRDGKAYAKLLLLLLFPIFHISYGLGTLKGYIDKFLKNRRWILEKRI